MAKKYPIKLLDSYLKEDRDIFFGRAEEVKELYEMVFQSDILLVYGMSGCGKTSLLQCGFTAKFEEHDCLALYVRRGKDMILSLEKVLQEAITEPVFESLGSNGSDNVVDLVTINDHAGTSSLSLAFKAVYLNHFRPVYLIFDQFEEIYIFGTVAEQRQFIAAVREILTIEQPVKVIICIREEYLGYLNEFEKMVPQLFRKKLRIEPMNFEKTKKVIAGVAGYKRSNITLQQGEETGIVREIFDRVKGGVNAIAIQLPYLQVFLDKLYLSITGDHSRQADAVFSRAALEKLGYIGDVLQEFLEEQVMAISQMPMFVENPAAPDIIWKMLSPFASLEGTKEPISRFELYERLVPLSSDLIDRTIQALIARRILRYSSEDDLYEVAHDSLAQKISAKRSADEIELLEVQRIIKSQTALNETVREFLTERQLTFIEPFIPKLVLTQKEKQLVDDSRHHVETVRKRKQRRARMIYAAMAGVALVLAILAVWAMLERRKAFLETQKAVEEKKKAEEALAKAERLASSFYFFDNKLALAFQDNKFGFINKDATMKILNKYDKAGNFDQSGFAKVESNMGKFLIDTLGTEYRVAYGFSERFVAGDPPVAIDLRDSNFNAFPQQLFSFKGLKIILLDCQLEKISRFGTFPDRIREWQELEYLSAFNCGLERLPDAIGALTHLQVLNLSFNKLRYLPAAIGRLRTVKKLDLSDNRGLKLSGELTGLHSLSDLDLSDDSLFVFPMELLELHNLKRLDLRGNKLSALPARLSAWRSLEYLDLGSNVFQELPGQIREIKQLRFLNLNSNRISLFPDELTGLSKLVTINLAYNKIQDIPASFANLSALENVDLTDNNLSSFPDAITRLQQLRLLVLSNNKITSIPSTISRMQELRMLVLRNNGLQTISAEVLALKKLQVLDLTNNKLSMLPEGVSHIDRLKELYLSGNQFASFPLNLSNANSLIRLDLERNKLSTLPASIGELKELTYLNLLGNSLVDLPTEIGNLSKLKALILKRNMLKSVPAQIGQLARLESLDLSDNLLTELPVSIGRLRNLSSLDLHNNRFTDEEKEKIKKLLPKCDIKF